jgi:predicted PurR-regulated permease PerM
MIYLYQPFLMSITIAILLAIATSNINEKLLFKTSKLPAAIISTILLSLMFFAPLLYFISSLVIALNDFDFALIDRTIHYFEKEIALFNGKNSFITAQITEFLNSISVATLAKDSLNIAANLGRQSAAFLKDIILILIFYFFANYYGKEIVKFIKKIIPLAKNATSLVIFEISNVMSVVFYSIIVTAVFEGLLFALMIGFLGYDALLLGILYGFASLIPVVGGLLMWLPLAAYEVANGQIANALIISIYSIIVISIIADTFIKPLIIKYINEKFLKTPAKINEILIFFAILAGLATFGFWGMILGPAITTLFISILKIYENLTQDESFCA